MITKCFFSSLICFFTLSFSAPLALAQDFDTGAESLGDEMLFFQEIPSVFGASKYEQKVTEAPSAISIVTAGEIAKYGYRTFSDILRSLKSFHISNDLAYEYVGVRGFGIPGDYNTRILVIIDGHRVRDNIYDSWIPGHGFPVDIDLIDRIEVIRGPSSSLYGTGAFFGVINVITKRGRDYQGAETAVSAASHDSYQTRLSYGSKRDNGLEILLSATAYDSEGRNWYYPELDDPATNFGIADGQDMERSFKTLLKASYKDFTLNGNVARRDKNIPNAPWWMDFNENSQNRDYSWYVDLQYEHIFANQLSLTGRISYNVYEYEGFYPYFWDGADILADYGLSLPSGIYDGYDDVTGNWWIYEIQASKQLWEKHKFIAGLEYQNNTTQDQAYFNLHDFTETRVFSSHEQSTVGAAYLQDEIRLRDHLILNIGLRHDDYQTFGTSTNPRIAVIFNPVQKTNLKFLYGQAFRAPNVYEMYYHDGGISTKSNPHIAPEEITTYEMVWEQEIEKHLRSEISLFHYKIDNLIGQVIDPADGLLVFDNQNRIKASGIEFQLEGKWQKLEGRISYTYQKTENEETGSILSNSPRNLLKININIPMLEGKIYTGLEVQAMSARMTPENSEVDGYSVTNLTFFSDKLMAEKLKITASIANIFNKHYSDPGSEEHFYQPDGIEQDGRTFRFKLSYAF